MIGMNIILLSGGSGKRLWPLSNDVRSKQFIKLFKDDSGEYESMVQRVYRQIETVGRETNIVIATSKSQVSSIHNQVGENVNICIEPMRRDTFPAIFLAALYLRDVMGVHENDCVAVCPVDPYVEDDYYQAVLGMEELVLSDSARLTLMGIEPTVASDKYGYIIPESADDVSRVKAFREKPDIVTAEEYIRVGALWNAGVFAFRLGYIIGKGAELTGYSTYDDLYENYEKLEKISFDYAVAEKEASIQVMRYSGEWKDVGTWNMMTEVMADNVKGTAILDNACKNTQVVNELDIPILVMGAKNMVVAASGDGILVADKNRSGYMKPYVEQISTEVKYAEKSWGEYQVIDAGPGYMSVKVTLTAGNRMSYHMHKYREEIWTVLSGMGRVIIDGNEKPVKSGDVIMIRPEEYHTIIADTEMMVQETQIGDNISVSDKFKSELI